MNDLQSSLLESISILAKSASEAAPATLTIEAVVLNVVDAGSGLYLVEYLGNKFQAYADAANKFSIGEMVYVMVPNGDFTKNKIILRSVTPTAKNYIENPEQKTFYNNASENAIVFDNLVSLSSYKNEIEPLEIKSIEKVVREYFKNGYKTFKLGVSVKTEIIGQSYGNFGLILNIPTTDGGTRQHLLDINDMIGNPYALGVFTEQSKVFSIEDLDLTRSITLYVFTDGFIENEELVEQYDIFLQNFSLYAVDTLTGIKETAIYDLTLSVTDGNFFFNKTDKTIVPKFYVNGQQVQLEGYACYWFEEDANIVSNSKGYLTEGGLGWNCLNEKISVTTSTTGAAEIAYNTNNYYYTVFHSDFMSLISKRYKCVINYNGILISKVIELKNLISAPFDINLTAENESENFIKNSNITLNLELKNINGELLDKLIYIWNLSDHQDRVIETNFVDYITSQSSLIQVSFPSSKIDGLGIVRCYVYVIDEDTKMLKLIGSKAITLNVSENDNYILKISPNNLLYKYDSDGESPLASSYDGAVTLSGIEPLTARIYKRTGVELTENEYSLAKITWQLDKESLYKPVQKEPDVSSEKYDYYNGRTFPYSIANTFNKEKGEKALMVTAEVDGVTLTEAVNIQFIKEKESGLNGSKYTALLLYGDKKFDSSTDKRGQNLVAIKHTSKTGVNWYAYNDDAIVAFNEAPALNVKVYNNGNLIDDSNFAVEWSLFNAESVSSIFSVLDGKVSINTGNNKKEYGIIQAKITVLEASDTNTQEVLYCYYPIDVIEYTHDTLAPNDILLPLMSGGYNTVTYSKDGINPKYDTTKRFAISCTYNDKDVTNRFGKYVWSVSNPDILKLSANASFSHQDIIPVNRYDTTVNDLTVQVKTSIREIEEVSEKPEEIDKNAVLIELQHNQVYIKKLLNYIDNFYKNEWLGQVVYCKELLSYREKAIIELNKLFTILENIKAIRRLDLQADALEKQLIDMRTQLYNFIEHDYDLYKLSIRYVANADELASVKLLANDFTDTVRNYNQALVNLQTYAKLEQASYEKAIDAYASIKNISLQDIEDIGEDVILQFNIVRDKAQEIIDGVKYQLNAADLNAYFNNITTILSNYGNWQENHYELNTGLKNWFLEESNRVEADYSTQVQNFLCDTRQKNSENLEITIKRPLMFLYERTDLTTVQGWDGNKLYVNNKANEYLTSITTAVGSTSESSFNMRSADSGFNGVAIGTNVKIDKGIETKEQGIYGYYKGQKTFMINATNGKASFGKDGSGQIILDPSTDEAIITSGNYKPAEIDDKGVVTKAGEGMEINLSAPSITYGSGKFSVDSEGILSANDAVIRGTIYANSGEFSGTINAADGSTFRGTVYAEKGEFTGTISADAGRFGNLKIEGNKIVIVTKREDGTEDTKDFIDEEGNANVSFDKQGVILTATGSNIGDWYVADTNGKQHLQSYSTSAGTGLILDPHAKNIHFTNIGIDTFTKNDSADSAYGFYLGKEGLTIPNVFTVAPNANDGQRWTMNSQELKWQNASQTLLKLGGNGVNLLNQLNILTSGIEIKSSQVNFSNSTNVQLSFTKDATFKGSANIILQHGDSSFVTVGENITLKTENFYSEASNFSLKDNEWNVKIGEKNLLTGTLANDVTTLNLNSGIVSIKEDNILVTNNEVTFKEGISVGIGKNIVIDKDAKLFLYDSNKVAHIDIGGGTIAMQGTSVKMLDKFTVETNKVTIDATYINLPGVTFDATGVTFTKGNVIVNSTKFLSDSAEVSGGLSVSKAATIGEDLTVTGNGSIQTNLNVQGNFTVQGNFIVGTTTFSDTDMQKLRRILDAS